MSFRGPLWPMVLAALNAAHRPLSCTDIGVILGVRPESVYASMSNMGKQANRRWIVPVAQWSRRGEFAITSAGRKALHQHNLGRSSVEDILKALFGDRATRQPESAAQSSNVFLAGVDALIDETFPEGIGAGDMEKAADLCEAFMLGISTVTIATACAQAKTMGLGVPEAMQLAKRMSGFNMKLLDELTAEHALRLSVALALGKASGDGA